VIPFFRVGIPENTGALPLAAERAGLPVMVSANRFWDDKKKRFRLPGTRIGRGSYVSQALTDLDIALDSGGFVAMKHYGGFRYTVADYIGLTGAWGWAHCFAMDLCCEPELGVHVDERLRGTAKLLLLQRLQVDMWRGQGAVWLRYPVPVIQGWAPDDYRRSIELTDQVLGGEWPEMVGLGSVCRRGAYADIAAVIAAVDLALPRCVGLHLFGVKGPVLARLVDHPRLISADSQAWDYAERRQGPRAGREYKIGNRAKRLVEFARAHEREVLRGP